jgi:hypothetical protein
MSDQKAYPYININCERPRERVPVRIYIYVLLLLLLVPAAASGQSPVIIPMNQAYKRVYTASRITGSNRPVIDGRIDEVFWDSIPWSDTFVQVTPYERAASADFTKMKLGYDSRFIYVAIYCKDTEPAGMNRFINNRDANATGDLVSIAFDTYHDFRAAPEFNINLGGNRTDLVVTDKLAVNLSWNAVWEARTAINPSDSSWQAEMRIPFSQLRYNQSDENNIWGLHVRRIIRRKGEVQNWSMIPLKNNGHVFSFGELHGMKDLPQPRSIELLPFLMGKYRQQPQATGNPYLSRHSAAATAGLDAKANMGDFTMDMTVNPDFGQVELDPSVMNLTAYETFYDEKRPFFLEGKHIFDFASGSDMMFYSRRTGAAPSFTPQGIDNINSFSEKKENVPITGAVKLTGSTRAGLTIGLMQSLVASSTARVTREGVESEVQVEPMTSFSVIRMQKNRHGNTLLGGMITSVNRIGAQPHIENLLPRNAHVAGVDFIQYFKDRLYFVDAKGMLSHLTGTREAILRLQENPVHYFQRTGAGYLRTDDSRTSLTGTGGYLKGGRRGNARWAWSQTVEWASPGFDMNDAGYLKQADFISNSTAIEFRHTNVWHSFRNNQLILTQKNTWNYGGTAISNQAAIEWKSMLMSRYELNISEAYSWNQVDTRLLRGGGDMRLDPSLNSVLTFNTDKSRRLVFTAKYTGTHHSGMKRSYNTVSPSLAVRMARFFLLTGQVDYSLNNDPVQYIGRGEGNSPSILGAMRQKTLGVTMKLQANLTPDVSLQLYASPFSSTARYSDFALAADPIATDPNMRTRPITGDAPVRMADGRMITPSTTMFDFSFNEFRANMVARWEYRPGSTIYLVWERRGAERDGHYSDSWGSSLRRALSTPSQNTIMLKINYWINL